MNANKINWYPGHMKKAVDNISESIKNVDFIIEVVDARAIQLTSNNELLKIVGNKPIIKVALKSDLSDLKQHPEILIGSIKDKNFKSKIIETLNEKLKEKIEKKKSSGIVKYQFVGMVLGIPNIGKSSLINFLSSSKSLITQNRPGVTKNQTMKKVNENYYLIDTPGVLFKNIENMEDGYKLAILNCININVLPMNEIVKYGYQYFIENYWSELSKYFQLKNMIQFNEFLDLICDKYKFLLKNNEYDYDRALIYLYNLFSKSEIMKFSFR